MKATTLIALLLLGCVAGVALAQDEQAATESPAAQENANVVPKRCRLSGGGFEALSAVALVLDSAGAVDEAELCLVDALQSAVPAFRQLSDIAARKQQFTRAAVISGIVERIDGSADSRLYHATRLLQAGDAEGANQRLEPIAKANAELASVQHLLGVAKFRLGKNDEAVESLKLATSLAADVKLYADDLKAIEDALSKANEGKQNSEN